MRVPNLQLTECLLARSAPKLLGLILIACFAAIIATGNATSPAAAQTPQGSGKSTQSADTKSDQPAGGPQAAPQSPPKVCKECQALADDVAFIQGRIDQLQRSQASMRKYANLSDPNVQNALKDDDSKIASLQKLLDQQKAKLAKCIADKCKPPVPSQPSNTVPATPGLPQTPAPPPPPKKDEPPPGKSTGADTPWDPWDYWRQHQWYTPPPRKTYDGGAPRKAKPVQYVKVCSLYGPGWYNIPGTDTCVRIGGWIGQDTHYDIDRPNWSGGSSCDFGCGGRNELRPADLFTPRTWLQPQQQQQQPDASKTWRGLDIDYKFKSNLDLRTNFMLRSYWRDELEKVQDQRSQYLNKYWKLSDSAKPYFDAQSTLGIFNKDEASIRGRLQDFMPRIDTASLDSGTTRSDVPTLGGGDTASANNPPADNPPLSNSPQQPPSFEKTAQPPPDARPPASAPPASPPSDQQSATGGSNSQDKPLYIVIDAKIIHSATPGKVGDPEPGTQLALNGPKYPFREQNDNGQDHQDGHDATRPFCVTIPDGTCEVHIEIRDKTYYGLGRVDLDRINVDFETPNYRGGFNVVGKDPPAKLDTATDGGNTTDWPSSFNIGSVMVARHTFTTPNDGSDGYPKRIKFTVDNCLFILPAPWGAAFDAPPAHSDLPMTAIRLEPIARSVP